jgi:hypothetical protein
MASTRLLVLGPDHPEQVCERLLIDEDVRDNMFIGVFKVFEP